MSSLVLPSRSRRDQYRPRGPPPVGEPARRHQPEPEHPPRLLPRPRPSGRLAREHRRLPHRHHPRRLPRHAPRRRTRPCFPWPSHRRGPLHRPPRRHTGPRWTRHRPRPRRRLSRRPHPRPRAGRRRAMGTGRRRGRAGSPRRQLPRRHVRRHAPALRMRRPRHRRRPHRTRRLRPPHHRALEDRPQRRRRHPVHRCPDRDAGADVAPRGRAQAWPPPVPPASARRALHPPERLAAPPSPSPRPGPHWWRCGPQAGERRRPCPGATPAATAPPAAPWPGFATAPDGDDAPRACTGCDSSRTAETAPADTLPLRALQETRDGSPLSERSGGQRRLLINPWILASFGSRSAGSRGVPNAAFRHGMEGACCRSGSPAGG